MRQHHERTEYLRLHDRARMGRRLSYGQSATQLVRTPPGLQTWNSTPASVAELPSFQPVDCSIPWRTEAIFGTPTPIPQQTTATLEDLLARHLASNADVHTTFTIPRISADQLNPVHLQDDLQILSNTLHSLQASLSHPLEVALSCSAGTRSSALSGPNISTFRTRVLQIRLWERSLPEEDCAGPCEVAEITLPS